MIVSVHKHKGKWRVYDQGSYADYDEVFLKNVFFFIVPELQKQVRETGKKVPHAFAIGELVDGKNDFPAENTMQTFDYDVFIQDKFTITASNTPVSNAKYVKLGIKNAFLL